MMLAQMSDDTLESPMHSAGSCRGITRVNSLTPPYSPQSQWAAICVVCFTCGVVGAKRLPPMPQPPALVHAMQAWAALGVVWSLLLLWLLIRDPRAEPLGGKAQSVEVAQCKHGCIVAQAARTKHCRRCGKCIVGFDHHCLWLNTCVGARNYRVWVVFVASLFVWAVVSSAISWVCLIRALPVQGRRLAVGHRPATFFTALGTSAAALWTLVLLGLHAYLAYNNMTTFEWVKRGYTLPTWRLRRLRPWTLRMCSTMSRVPSQTSIGAVPLAGGGAVANDASGRISPQTVDSGSADFPQEPLTVVHRPRAPSTRGPADGAVPWKRRLSYNVLGAADHGHSGEAQHKHQLAADLLDIDMERGCIHETHSNLELFMRKSTC